MRKRSESILRPGLSDLLPIALGIALLAMLFPTATRVIGGQPWRVELLATITLLCCFAAAYIRDRDSLLKMFSIGDERARWMVLSLAAFTSWGLLSIGWADLRGGAWHHTLVWTAYILFFLFAFDRLRSGSGYRFIATVFLTVAAIISILCLIDYATLPDFRSLEGILRSRYSKYAELLITALPIVWIASLYTKSRPASRLIVLVAGGGWITVMLSLSKGAFVAGIAGFLLAFAGTMIFCRRRMRQRVLVLAGIWAAITVLTQAGSSFLSTVPSTSEYLTGSSGQIRESSMQRFFVWNIAGQMISSHPAIGVGANNFGIMFNDARSEFREKSPEQPVEELLSEQVPERAHNELLQVLAELGLVGLALFIIPAVLFASMLYRGFRGGFRGSPMFWAALGGVCAFAASSMASSFSFRLAQNGIVFFLVLAVTIRELVKKNYRAVPFARPLANRLSLGPAAAAAGIFVLLITCIVTFGLREAADRYASAADAERDAGTALELYKFASKLDRENGLINLRSAGRSRKEKDHAQAALQQRWAIDNGLGIVLTYSILADDHAASGDQKAAEETLVEALKIFPRSVFLRVRYALMLRELGRNQESQQQLTEAFRINEAQAGGWVNILKDGSVAAFYASRSDPRVAAPADLRPEAAVQLYLDKSPEAPF